MKKKKKFENYNIGKIIVELKPQIKFAIYAIIIVVLLGLINKSLFINFQDEFFSSIIEKTKNLSYLGLVLFIFFHNILANLLIVILGFTILFPFFALIVNGFLIGAIIGRRVAEKGVSVILALIPHGIFEVPAIILSLALGFKIATSFAGEKNFIKIIKKYWFNYKKAFFLFLLVIIPLLLVAALIEAMLIYYNVNIPFVS